MELQIAGKGLADATNLWTSFPATYEFLGAGKFRITPSEESTVGVASLRVFGPSGVSPVVLMLLDDLPTTVESKTNQTISAAQRIEFGSALDGRCEELAYDWFKLRVSKGQRVALEVVAARLGSKMDSVVRVVSNAGREIGQVDDVPGLRADSYLAFIAPESDDYFVEVRDVNYGGGQGYFYRLKIGDFPLVTTTFPVAVKRGREQMIRLAGPFDNFKDVTFRVSSNSAGLPLAIKGQTGSAFATVTATSRREELEVEPNDDVKQATQISLDGGVNGRFDRLNDRDCFEFSARKGERWDFRAATRSVGSPCDVLMQLESSDGKRLGRSNPTAADEGVLTYTFTSNGVYRLSVEEANGASGPNLVYRFVSHRSPGFALSLDSDTFNAAPGKEFEMKVSVARADYKGDVQLALAGVAEPWVLTNSVIAAGKSNVTMKVTVPDTFLPGEWKAFGVMGSAMRNGEEVQVRASTASVLRKRWPLMLHPPAVFDEEVALGITAETKLK